MGVLCLPESGVSAEPPCSLLGMIIETELSGAKSRHLEQNIVQQLLHAHSNVQFRSIWWPVHDLSVGRLRVCFAKWYYKLAKGETGHNLPPPPHVCMVLQYIVTSLKWCILMEVYTVCTDGFIFIVTKMDHISCISNTLHGVVLLHGGRVCASYGQSANCAFFWIYISLTDWECVTHSYSWLT